MKWANNERGGALVMVLLIILVFTILGMSVLGMNLNATKQFNKKEKQVQARHQAEMGVLHHKEAIVKAVNEFNSDPDNYRVKIDGQIDESKSREKYIKELCTKVKTVNSVDHPVITEGNYYESKMSHTGCDKEDEITAEITSTGFAGDVSKEIDATIVIASTEGDHLPTPPPSSGNEGPTDGGPPNKPNPPSNGNKVKREWPCSGKVCEKKTTYYEFFDVPSATVQKGDITIKNHLVVGSNFEVSGGNGLDLTVEGDFYITKNLFTRNHACIYVKGDFTVGESIYLGSKGYIFVEGNANLPSNIKLQNTNTGIFVLGQVYGTNPTQAKSYSRAVKECGAGFADVTLPPDDSSPSEEPVPPSYEWEVEDSVNAIYK